MIFEWKNRQNIEFRIYYFDSVSSPATSSTNAASSKQMFFFRVADAHCQFVAFSNHISHTCSSCGKMAEVLLALNTGYFLCVFVIHATNLDSWGSAFTIRDFYFHLVYFDGNFRSNFSPYLRIIECHFKIVWVALPHDMTQKILNVQIIDSQQAASMHIAHCTCGIAPESLIFWTNSMNIEVNFRRVLN